MTTNTTSQSTNVREAFARAGRFRLRDRLFLASALLSTSILLIAAWVINNQVVRQARQQVQTEVQDLLPVYNAVWEENARSLATLGQTMANSPNVKIIFGNERAARDRETIREMIADFGGDLASRVDLVLITDGAGKITFAEMRGNDAPPVTDLTAARAVADSQQQRQCFAIFGGRLFQLSLTPILLQSGSDEYQNTLAVLGTGLELSRAVAGEIRNRVHSDVVFLTGERIYASSLAPEAEAGVAQAVTAPEINRADPARPVEVRVGGQPNLAFSRQLPGFDGQRVGQVVVLRSLAGAGRLFRSISNLLLLLWTVSIAAAFAFSFLIARRITRPMGALMAGTREYGRGNYDYEIKADTHGELGELAGAFDQMRRSLKQTQAELLKRERLATIGQMAGSIVHDLRNPLATISTAAEMLNRAGLAPERRQTLLESQLRASQRMHEMLRGLLDFTRGSYNLELEPHSLGSLVERAVKGIGTNAARASIVIETDVAADLFVRADAGQLRRVFENLLTNAVQAMPDGGRVAITAIREGDHARIDVADDGPGIPAEIRERLFEPFVSHGKLGGTGLGLAIAQSIVEAHGGSIGLDPAATRGAKFFITLPLDSV
ncbi:MAG TPA: ATP-binding protein [Blastocatellia bacterium]|nr:ATP-binding protein [Blastocatellia bacterium]